MEFEIPTALQPILRTIRELFVAEVYPLEQKIPVSRFREALPVLQGLRKRVKDLGLWAPQLPKEVGGMGLSLADFAYVSEELGRSPYGHFLFNCQAPDAGNMEVLLQHGTPEQRERFLMPLAEGRIRSCFSMTEPEYPGSNPAWMGTTAIRDGDHYIIDGHKWFTSSAEGANFAIVMAVTHPEAKDRHLGASQILVPLDTPGFQLVRNISVMGEPGEDYASHAEVRYSDCRVPVTNRLGAEGAGFAIAQERLGPGRIHHCMRWIGICERAQDLMCQRAASRQLGPNKPLGTRQVVQHWIAECRAEIHGARLMVLHAAHKLERHGSYAAREDISLIKFHVAGVLQRVLDKAVQVHGALGMTDDTPLAYWFRHERAARIYDGPDEVHKTVVAKRILRGYGLEVS